MGRPKPLLPWHDVPLVEYQTHSLLQGGVTEVVVVLGHEHQAVVPHVRSVGARSVVNPLYRQGKTTSIKAGIRAVGPAAEGILLLAVDQPRPPEIISAVIEAHLRSGALITSPRYHGRGGHPLIFASTLKQEFEVITEQEKGIRAVFQAHRDEINHVPIDDPIIRLDINSPEAYEEAKARYGA